MRQRAQSSTSYPLQFLLVLSSDHITGATGKTPTITISKNGGAFGAAAGAVTEIANGVYSLAGNATDRNTLGELWAHITATGCDTVDMLLCEVVTVDVFAANQGLALPTALVGGRMDSTTQAMASGVITSTVIAADAIGASQLATDAIGSNEISAAAVTKIQAGLSTYAGADTAGTTTLLSRLTAIRAALLDNIDVAVSTRLAAAGYTAPDNTTIGTINTKIGTPSVSVSADIATRAPSSTAVSNADLTPTRAANLDNLDATVSSRSTLTAANVWQYVIEGTLTAERVMRIVLAGLSGILSGAATATIKIRDLANTKDRITATVDADGNRSNVTLDAS